MNNATSISDPVGETTDVEVWLARAGLKFTDLGNNATSAVIRRQWREYQAAVYKCCILLHLPAEAVQLSDAYAHLRIPCITGDKRQESAGRG
ncbi:hypothetical protein H6G80_08100 [Nostoc sp. FACHB-87]|uniref:hypothetical protein n=1 Tax=Nostocaceae TaxID=1162 RepID=UPI00168A3F0C|nr:MULTISPECIES: hypothetical protein [Nostocaceae]MBD2454041.1 hypothetical protein [Nostoc sp. FACHB-87]MBD2476264.1 hypothetical protein [Anabaena sp. FACHB-83]